MKIFNLIKRPVSIIICYLFATSCVSRQEIVYFQGIEQLSQSQDRNLGNNLEIQPDDILTIRVSAPEPEAAIPFNLTKTFGSQLGMNSNVELETYMVTNEGTIQFPVIGTVEVKGLTNNELAEKIKTAIEDYVKDPIVNVRILNFQISVIGEVSNPGTFNIQDDHVTLTKALAMAGDLTIFGKRENILIMGEEEGKKTYAYLDLTDANIVNSPHYNLRQNDVVYVEPIATRRQKASSTGIASTYLSIASVLASLILLITR